MRADTHGKRHKEFVDLVNDALNQLPATNRLVIYRSLIQEQSDIKIGLEMNYSEFRIRDFRVEGIRLLSYALGVDKYEN